MKRRQLAGWLVLLSIAATGCGSATQDATPPTNTTTLRADENRQAAATRKPKPRKGPKLKGKFRNLAAGDGDAPECRRDLSSLPAGFATSPAVWMSTIQGPSNLVFTGENALCLHGFTAEQAVTITVADGRHGYTTTAQPTAGKLTFDVYEPPESLFNGARLRVYDIGSGVMQSETWDFVPQSAARESLAAAGHFTISATQGSTTASYRQSVAVPTNPERARLRGESKRRLVVAGFKQGDTIPIGLYRLAAGASDQATLVRQLGSVVMPRSRTAVFAVPQSAAGSTYCVTVPLATQYNCPSF
ncbi:hypothetical protein [Streptomyces sp. NRRL WC-3618]|uniref:hypothetical protein n=1 Tax=Streptomyces sp. NRRL WC-3618 TaxID=1519490 RepID=UPI000AB19147|nr:hypothetical protein [Streptomyces sp. NRRL WC-3618]